jgi:hypothetical protein
MVARVLAGDRAPGREAAAAGAVAHLAEQRHAVAPVVGRHVVEREEREPAHRGLERSQLRPVEWG